MSSATAQATKDEIIREVERVQETSYGETDCHVDVALHETFVAVIMDLHLSLSEEALIEAGNAASVKVSRDAFQQAIATTFTAIIEHATGRRVIGFGSRAVVDEGPAWTMDVFRLAKTPSGA